MAPAVSPSSATATPSSRQSTLQHHFNSAEQKRTHSDPSPPSKRRKTDLHQHQQSSCTAPRVSVRNMYNFGTKDNAIDLTASPPASPKARRISAASPLSTQNGATPTFGAKKLVVKNLKKSSSRSGNNDYCARTIEDLDKALTAILTHKSPARSNEELYRGCENVCRMQRAPELSQLLDRRCKAHISGPVKSELATKADDKNINVLQAIVEAWNVWQKQSLTIRSIFFFMDRSYLLQTSNPSIQESAVRYFRDNIFGHSALAGKAVEGACDLLSAERTQTSPNHALFKDAVDMFHHLSVYTTELEPHMLAVSQKYIADWADRECSERDLPNYVAACGNFIEAEMTRCVGFDLDSSTKRELLTLLEHHLIERKENDLIDGDAVAILLDADNLDALGATYKLLQRRRMGLKLKEPFNEWIGLTGTNIVFDEKCQDQMVVRLLELKQKLDKVWRTSFEKNQAIGHGLREAFETFVNKSKKTSATWGTDNSKPGEMIAKYIDNILRGGAKAIPTQLSASVAKQPTLTRAGGDDEEVADEVIAGDEDAEVENQLDQVLDLFRFIHGKAVFEAFYKKDLARRLLMGRSASNDAEKSMLNRLQAECGSSFTHNLEQMFRDVELARDEMGGYKDRLQATDRIPDIDLNVNILSAAAWPTYPDIPCVIPAEIQSAIANFEQYYNQKHTGRKLAWKHALAHCQLRARFNKSVKEMVVSSFQAIVLLLFNDLAAGEQMSYERIKAESGLTEAEVKRTLQSLACAKLRPLTKHPKGREVNDTDTFTVNDGFTHERYRVKINTIQMKETAEENKETHERVAADRQYETQAAIVRIMKSRKEIAHPELIAETIKATKSRGTLQPGDIKRNIDKLIDKEYMERVEGNRYAYIA